MKISRIIIVILLIFFSEISFLIGGNFNNSQEPLGTNRGLSYSATVIGDIDNDNDLDVVIIGEHNLTNEFKVFKNDGTGNYTLSQDLTPAMRSGSLALGDIDSDGDLDLIASGWDGTTRFFKVYTNNNGIFTFKADIPPPVNDSYIALADLDEDGDLDIVMEGDTGSGTNVNIYTNDGKGNFGLKTTLQGISSGEIVLGDVDNDNDIDIVINGGSTSVARYFRVYKNNGDATFTLFQNISPALGESSIAMGDIDSDGDLDLVSMGEVPGGARRLIVYKNIGNGTFVSNSSIGNGIAYGSLAVGDIDSDGDLDLIITGSETLGNKFFQSYVNDGTGSFSLNQTIDTFNGLYRSSIVLGDVDNDGDLDLVVTGEDGSGGVPRFIIYKNDETTVNHPPLPVIGLHVFSVNNKWRLLWKKALDDHTSNKILRYQVAYGTNSENYTYVNTNIMYPRGDANLGNVSIVTAAFYQTPITNTKTIYWKVCAIDSAFKHTEYSLEYQWPYKGPFYVSTKGRDIDNNGSKNYPFKTIQRAVDIATKGYPICTNSTIYVEPGIYTQQVVITNNPIYQTLVITSLSNTNRAILTGNGFTNFAFFITNADNIVIKDLKIKRFAVDGIHITGDSTNISLIGNDIYSNLNTAIMAGGAGTSVEKISIISNIICGQNNNSGVFFSWVKNSKIRYNRIFKNKSDGLHFLFSQYNLVSHNFIYTNYDGPGFYLNGSNNEVYTNYIYKNNNEGIKIIYYSYNIIKSNSIYSNGSAGIDASIVLSSGVENTIISNKIFYNKTSGIVAGRKLLRIEGNYIYNNIENGIFCNSSTNLIIGNYIYQNGKGISISASTNIKVINNEIYRNNYENLIIYDSYFTLVSNNNIYHSALLNIRQGIYISGTNSKNIYILNNNIYSNIHNNTNCIGITIDSSTITNIFILSNNFYGVSVPIYNKGADKIYIKKNNFDSISPLIITTNKLNYYNNIYAFSNEIISNNFINNGIAIVKGSNYIVSGNIFFDIYYNTAIRIKEAKNFIIKKNNIKRSKGGISISLSEGDILYNSIISNGRGILLTGNTAKGRVYCNNILYNTNEGILISRWDGSPDYLIRKNNIYSNFLNFATETNYDVRTNWWGTSLSSLIESKFGYYGPPGTINIDYQPYRLWHKYNIEEGADNEPLPIITGFTAYVTNFTYVRFKWNSVSSDPDFIRYFVYCGYSPNNGILEHSSYYILTNTTSTNFKVQLSGGVYYFWVTSGDNPSPPVGNIYTNESWYSSMQTVTIGTGTNVHNIIKNKWYWTIQQAINDASTGDTLLVYPGGYPVSGSKVYKENIEISPDTTKASNLSIIATNWKGYGIIDTVIDGSGGDYSIFVASNYRITLKGFVIKNDTDNGVELYNSYSNIISHNIFRSNDISWSGTGIPPFGLFVNSSLAENNVIFSNKFYNNIIDIGLLGAQNNIIYNNSFYSSYFEGVGIADDNGIPAKYNVIKNNLIYNQSGNGIGFHFLSVSNIVISNIIERCTNGIYFEGNDHGDTPPPGASENILSYNIIRNGGRGIIIDSTTRGENNRIIHNIITNNSKSGIVIISSNFVSTAIESNFLRKNSSGVYITLSSKESISSNKLFNNIYGINIVSGSNMQIVRNYIKNNSSYGIIATNTPDTLIKFNNIISNNVGIWYKTGSVFVNKNNIYSNTYNVQEPISPVNQFYTNNWWGSTVYSNIVKKISGSPPPPEVFSPWRLEGRFDISENADTETPERVDNLHSVIIDNTNVVITWSPVSDEGGGTVVRYRIYKSFTNSPYNLSRNNIAGEVLASDTVFTDIGGWDGKKVYYTVTALDDYPIYTNESWYNEATSPSTNIKNITKNRYYSTLKDAIYDSDGGGIFNEIRILKATNYFEQYISITNDQNILLSSGEFINNGTGINTKIISTNKTTQYIFKVRNNGRLRIEGISIIFKGTNEDFNNNIVSAAIKYNDTANGSVKHIIFNGFTNGKMGIYLNNWGSLTPVDIISNKFIGFNKSGIHINNSAIMLDNIFTNCGSAIEFDGGSQNSYASNNIIKGCGVGFYFYGNDDNEKAVYNLIIKSGWSGIVCDKTSYPSIINNTIAHGNGDSGILIESNASPIVKNNIIFSNGNYGIYGVSTSSPLISYNNVYGALINNFYGTATPGTGDISQNPLFIGGNPFDYHLSSGSPSIAAGENNVDQGCFPYNTLLRILLGDNTKPVGTFQSTESNIPMVQIKFKTETSKSVLLKSITFTNYGTSDNNLPLEINSVSIYADVNNDGLIDASDIKLGLNSTFGTGKYASILNINLTIPGYSETNLILVYNSQNAVPLETYWPVIHGTTVSAETNLTAIPVYGNVTGNTQTVSSSIDHFVIEHRTNYYRRVLSAISLTAKDSNDLTISAYNGTVSLWVLNDTAEVFWTNITGNGDLIDGGSGNDWAKYHFEPADNGVVTLYVMYYTNGYINIEARDTNITTATDDDSEGDLHFTNAPVYNVSINRYYDTLQNAINNAKSSGINEIRLMYSYNEGDVVIATNTTIATDFYITSDDWVNYRNNSSVTMNASGCDSAIKIASSGRNFKVKIEGFTIVSASNNGIELLENTTYCTIAHMRLFKNGINSLDNGPEGFGIYISDNQLAETYNNSVYSNLIEKSKWGIAIVDADNNYIFGNILKYNAIGVTDGGGIAVASLGAPTTNNFIYNNQIISNVTGIYLGYNGDNIYHNKIYTNNLKYNDTGIILEDADKNYIFNNRINSNTNTGISLWGTASFNNIYSNIICGSKYYGINIDTTNKNVNNNNFYNNNINNNNTGIFLSYGNLNKIYLNNIYNNTNGIVTSDTYNIIISNNNIYNNKYGIPVVNSSNTFIAYNNILNNLSVGVWFTNSPLTRIILNNITNNDIGIHLYPSKYTNSYIIKNNLSTNISTSIYNPKLVVGIPITNNWWGTTKLSLIKNKVYPLASYNYIPYRLRGKFNIEPGADTETLPVITVITASANGPQINLKWNKSQVSTDFIAYVIYRSTNSGYSNLSSANIVAQIDNINITNYVDVPPQYNRWWYYHITAIDDPSPPIGNIYTNECWYSTQLAVSNEEGRVHILPPKDEWFMSITNAIKSVTNNCIIEVYPSGSPYFENIVISNITNLILRSYDWLTSTNNKSVVINGDYYGIKIIKSKDITLEGFTIKSSTNAVILTNGSYSNFIKNNNLLSNKNGILLTSAKKNSIMSNYISHSILYGISILNSSTNYILNNNIYSNKSEALYLNGIYANYNKVFHNNIYQNGGSGVYIISGAKWNEISTNIIRNNSLNGIYVDNDTEDNNLFIDNVIYNNTQIGIYIRYGDSINIINNKIKRNGSFGIQLYYTSTNVKIKNNIISTNGGGGISLNNFPGKNIIASNIIAFNSGSGIENVNGDNNLIEDNKIFKNTVRGIYLSGLSGADNNIITNNVISNNTSIGIETGDHAANNKIVNNRITGNLSGINLGYDGSDYNIVKNNYIINTAGYGIRIGNADYAQISFNIISNNTSDGILIENIVDSSKIFNNQILNNSDGIYYDSTGNGSRFWLNDIKDNQRGFNIADVGIISNLSKNNFINNSIAEITNSTSSFVICTNNWFESTKVTNIAKKIHSNGGYTNFIPYRLFGPYDISEGADTESLPRVTWATGYVINGDDIVLKWNKTTGLDFVKYNIYRTTNETRWSNLSYAEVWTQINNISTTNITNYNMNIGTYYYYITAMDSSTPYTNECWYSPEAKVEVTPVNNGPFYVDDNSGDDTNPGTFNLPFRTIQHAANIMSTGVTIATTYIFPGIYNEQVNIYSNANNGYMIFTALSNSKPILHGSIGSNYGIYITNANKIKFLNLIVSKYTQGIYIGGASTNNFINHLVIYSNNQYGIYIDGNRCQNIYIMTNIIKDNEKGGIYINEADNIICFSNNIVNNSWYGIYLNGEIIKNNILNNYIFNHSLYGIFIIGTGYSNNIVNNTIKNNDTGIRFFDSDKNFIKNNLIFNSGSYGIYATGTFSSNIIDNNTIYSNNINGIFLSDDGADNNFIASNKIYGLNQNNGIYIDWGDNNIIFTNYIFDNEITGVFLTNSAMGNKIINNNIYSNNKSGIYVNSSLAYNNYFMTNYIDGTNQDYGIFIYNSPNNYIKDNKIYNNKYYGIYLAGEESDDNIINGNTIISSIEDRAIYISDGDRNNISGNILRNSEYGLYLDATAESNYISHNSIYSNEWYGIYINSETADNNYIFTNNIWGENQDVGIRFYDSDNNVVISNKIHNNQFSGVSINNDSKSNLISHNSIYSNGLRAIYIWSDVADNNLIYTNNIYGLNQNLGIQIVSGNNNIVKGNLIKECNGYGIYIKAWATNNIIEYNTIGNITSGTGVYSITNSLSILKLNTITNNNVGLYISANSEISNIKNNIYNNIKWNLCNNGGILVSVTNNWWGTTIATQIVSSISNSSSVLPYIPYRLFGPYDISEGADTESLPRVTWATAYVINKNDVVIKWNKTTGLDFVKYNIYRTTNETRWSNLSYAEVWTQINNISTTNITNYNMNIGTYYYYITAMDSSTPYTNECWYSPEAKVEVTPANVYNVTLNKWYATITNAIKEANNDNVITVYPGTYKENVKINGFNGIILQAYAFTNSGDNTSTLIIANSVGWNPITIDNSTNIIVNGFSLDGQSGGGGGVGIALQNNSLSNEIMNNIIWSNGDAGISIDSTSKYNHITNNILFKQTGVGLRDGILIGGKYNLVEYNKAYLHNGSINHSGIELQLGSYRNIIRFNTLYSNGIGIIVGGSRNSIFSNYITNNYRGVQAAGSTNYIYNNKINNNSKSGIYFDPFGSGYNYNIISDNKLIDNITNGLFVGSGEYNIIRDNLIQNSWGAGVLFTNVNNIIFTNNIIRYNSIGFKLVRVTNNIFKNNNIYSNNKCGIEINLNAISNIIENNNISFSSNGIYLLGGGYNLISYNKIFNMTNGIYYTTGTKNIIRLNSITNNNIGILLNSSIFEIDKNNIYNNTYNLYNSSGVALSLGTNWFGTTKCSNIDEKLYDNEEGAQEINFIPYRLFGKFDITEGADITNLSPITFATAYVWNNNNIVLKWSKTSGSDFVRYNIYKTTNISKWSNLTYNDVWTQINNISTTNITNFGVAGDTYYYYITAMDDASYTNETWYSPEAKVTVIADTTPPSKVSLILPVSNFITNYNSMLFKWTKSTDTLTGVTNYQLLISTNNFISTNTNIIIAGENNTNIVINNIKEGTNYWKVQAEDKAGNWSGFSNVWTFIVDMTPPTIVNLISPIDNIWTNNLTLSFKWNTSSDNLTGISNYQLFITNINTLWSTNIYTKSSNFTVNIKEGTNYWKVRAFDRANNISLWSTTNIIKVDIVSPSNFALLIPEDKTITNSLNINLKWNRSIDNLSGISNYEIFITNINNNKSTNLTTLNTNVTVTFSNGTNYWKVRSRDRANNISIFSMTNMLVVDTIAPSPVTLILPVSNSIITNKGGITYRWSKGVDTISGISNYIVFITNINNNWWTNITLKVTNIVLSNKGEGDYNWYVKAYDRANNYSVSKTNQFTVDTNNPTTVTLVSPVNNNIINSNIALFIWNKSSDNITGISNYQLEISTNKFTSIWSNIIITTTNYQINNLNLWTNYWRVRAQDRAGHWSDWSSINKLIVEPIYGNIYITSLHTGSAWNNTILESRSENNITLVSLKISANTYDEAIINLLKISLNYTNGASDTDFTNFILYYDVLGVGNFNNGTDITLSTDKKAVNGWIVFTNITGFTLKKNSSTNLLITFSHKNMTDTEGIKAINNYSNSVEFKVLNHSLTNNTISSIIGRRKEVYEPGFFKIIHSSSPWKGIVKLPVSMRVEVRRKIVTNEIVPWYDEVVTLDTTGIGNIHWTNISGSGICSNISSTTQGIYIFSPLDNGVVSLTLVDDTSESINVELTSVTGITDDDSEGLLHINYGELAYFKVIHNTNQFTYNWGKVVIEAIVTNGGIENILPDYTGNITINVLGGTYSTIKWTNISGGGTFITNEVDASVEYNFVTADNGVLTLMIKDNTDESVNINVKASGKRDINNEGYLHFISVYPYIKNINVDKNSYVTIDDIKPLTITFNELIKPSSVTDSIYFYDSLNNLISLNFDFITNTMPGNIDYTILKITPSINDNDILKKYLLQIISNITATNTNYHLISAPHNSEYSIPYYSEYTTLIDKDYGGIVTADDTSSKLIIGANVLPDDAYIEFNSIPQNDNDIIKEANRKADLNQFIKVIDNANVYKEITAFNKNRITISRLNGEATIKIKYNDSNNDGKVDGTDILESKLKLYYLDENNKEWDLIADSYVDSINNYVIAKINHFSVYGILADYQPKKFDESFITYPNPANPLYQNIKIKFYLEKDAKLSIKIYTITGQLVKTIVENKVFYGNTLYDGDKALIWDGRNGNGEIVVNGVYLVKVTGEYLDGSGILEKVWKQGIIK